MGGGRQAQGRALGTHSIKRTSLVAGAFSRPPGPRLPRPVGGACLPGRRASRCTADITACAWLWQTNSHLPAWSV